MSLSMWARPSDVHQVVREGAFVDIGCADGYLLESLPPWTPHTVDRYGLDIAPELIELAHRRPPELVEHLFVGNALHSEPPHRFTEVRTGLDHVLRHRRLELVERLLAYCDRLVIGVFNEETHARTTEDLLEGWGLVSPGAASGRTQ